MDSLPHQSLASRLLFGRVAFSEQEEYQGFRYKFLVVLMVSGALVTALLVAGAVSGSNPIPGAHLASMTFFTLATTALWLALRGHPERFFAVAWVYEAVCLWEDTSSLMYVPADELRILWFFINVPGVFILLGQKPGWVVTVGTVLGLAFGNHALSSPYSPNALATAIFALLYLGVFFHAYVDRSLSFFKRMRDYNVRLHELASHDALTGVLNARAYYQACDQQMRACERSGQDFAVIFVDLDHFKKINDTYGHAAGDEVLRVASATLRASIRRSDLLGRIGGEEFCMFLPDTNLEGALHVAEKIRVAIEASVPTFEAWTIPITASVGVASRSPEHTTMQAIQAQADEAMYAAKRAGRNRVSCLDAHAA